MQKRKAPMIIRLFVYLLILLLVAGIGVFWYLNYLGSPVSVEEKVVAFVIQKEETMDSVASRLESEGLVRSSFVFKYLLKQSGAETKIAAGDYKLSPSMSVREIITKMTQGGADDIWVTLLEGWRLEEVAIKLNKELGINKEQFLEGAKEGYMFPDTYLINKNATASDVALLLENTFKQRYSADLQSKIRAQGLTPEEGIILASLVEREARSDEIRTKVASIILNRLNMGMKLDIDATVQYAKDSQTLKSGKEPDKFWQPIRQTDYTEVASVYNTYLNNGLPPGPICNPSLSSLKAVANADSDTPYLYYFHDSQGNTYYAQTLEEHNQNIASHR